MRKFIESRALCTLAISLCVLALQCQTLWAAPIETGPSLWRFNGSWCTPSQPTVSKHLDCKLVTRQIVVQEIHSGDQIIDLSGSVSDPVLSQPISNNSSQFATLATLAATSSPSPLHERALNFLVVADDPAAWDALVHLLQNTASLAVVEHMAAKVTALKGDVGLARVVTLIDKETDSPRRLALLKSLSSSTSSRAVDVLLKSATNDPEIYIRRQAQVEASGLLATRVTNPSPIEANELRHFKALSHLATSQLSHTALLDSDPHRRQLAILILGTRPEKQALGALILLQLRDTSKV